MPKIICLILLCLSCAHKNSYDVGGYHNSLTSGMAFYSQYEIIYKTKGHIIVALFTSKHLPKDTIKLRLGIQIKNPSGIILTNCDNGFTQKTASQEFIGIDLPIEPDLEIKCSTSVIDNGMVLYKTQTSYKTKGDSL